MFLVIIIPMVNYTFIEKPKDVLTYHAYTDIANGVSTRVIDLYAIVPAHRYGNPATITTKFDIPDEVAGRDYWVEIEDGMIVISGDSPIRSTVSLAGIGETEFGHASGRTTASGLNQIQYIYQP